MSDAHPLPRKARGRIMPGMVKISVRLPGKVHRAAQAKAAEANLYLMDWVRNLIEEAIK
jgi:predicted HicB family RNase H-like nuclease